MKTMEYVSDDTDMRFADIQMLRYRLKGFEELSLIHISEPTRH